MAIDFEREGLLDGLDDPQGREARLDLLRQLSDAGVSLEQLKRAVEEDRLLGLPLELVFTRGMLFTLDDEDMESWRMLKLLFDAGISEEQILQLARPSGRWAAQLVDVLRQVFVEAFFEPGDTERDFGLRLAKLSADLVPTLGPLTERPVRLHLRERVRHDVISFTELTSGDLPGTREVGVCFADLVDFTRLSEQLTPEQLGRVTARLEALAGDVAEPPIRLIKLIGDAAMLVSPDVPALVGAAQTLVDAADEEEALPRLRAGLAAGSALNRGGDWYGRPVNLASRITDVAAAGTIVASEAVVDATPGQQWKLLERRPLKGIDEAVALFALDR